MTIAIHEGDCRDILDTLEANSVHACVTDPPYHLTQLSRGGHARTNNPETPSGRHRIGDKGFMGKNWDGGDCAFDPATWRKVLRVMKPGAYLVAFGGTRTYHRLACAIEDAGFEIRDQIGWAFGSGFPKGTDKAKVPPGWEGWNTALKPAWEPIVLARKPMQGSLATNLQIHGCGAMNIEGCRIETPDDLNGGAYSENRKPSDSEWVANGGTIHSYAGKDFEPPVGRWPANLIHDGSDEVLEHFPDAPGQRADLVGDEPSSKKDGIFGKFAGRGPAAARGDEGSAARFFYCAKADQADRNDGAQNAHPTVKPTDLMVWLCKLVTPPGGVILDPFMGSGSTGRGAALGDFGFIGIEGETEYVEIARRRITAIAPLFISA